MIELTAADASTNAQTWAFILDPEWVKEWVRFNRPKSVRPMPPVTPEE